MKFTKKIILFLTFFAFTPLIYCEDIDFDFNGYIYELPNMQKYPESFSLIPGYKSNADYIFSNIAKARLRPSLTYGMNTELTLHYEISSLWSDTPFPVLENQDIGIRQAADMNWEIVNEDKVKVNHLIDRLYWKQFFDFGELVVGRQRISWGVGRVWQLTDLFNPINPANFSKFEKDGADAVSGKVYLGNFSDLEMVVNFRPTPNDYNYGFRYRTNYNEYDLSAVAGYFNHRYVIATEIAGNLYDAGVRAEILFNADENNLKSNFYKLLFGIDYQLTDKLYAMLEYKHNGQGSDCKLCYKLNDLMQGKILNVGLDYLAEQVTYQIHPLVAINLMNINNTRDKSGFTTAGITYNAFQNLNIGCSGIYFYGDELTEYWYYSTSGYLTVEWYF